VQAQLVSEVKTIQPGTLFWVALRFKIRPGWHTYWQNPGDSGMSPTIKWTLPAGLKAGEIVWPHPERLPVGPLMNFGYKDEVYHLIEIASSADLPTDSPAKLRAQANWLVCEVECIPEQATLDLTLPVTTEPPPTNQSWAAAIDQTRQAVPKHLPWTTIVKMDAEQLALHVDVPDLRPGQIQEVVFFPYEDGIITNAAEQKVTFGDDGLTLRLERGYQTALDTVNGVLVIREKLDGQTAAQAFTIQAKVATSASPTLNTAPALNTPVWQALLLALLGGAILNLMPCVFPVLSLKALSIVKTAQQSPRQAQLHGVVFTAGVLASFAAIASVLIGLRAVGQQIGWGFQLQSPVFVTLMAYILFAVGLSLSGVFVVGASLMGIGQGLAARSGYMGEFFTGVFATVMATPCTAPFMATAIGVALTQPAPIAMAIFVTLGFGLALPYLVLSFTPALRRRLPKPGAWMETFQQLLAFPMYMAAAWLVWVLTQQTGPNGLAAALAGLVLISFAVWLHEKTGRLRHFRRRLGSLGTLVALGAAITLASLVGSAPTPTVQLESPGLAWEPYAVERLANLRQSGKPVFVNFTASWCISCMVNERVALNQPEVAAAFQEEGVTLLKADWTNRNSTITEALRTFGRSGVPLYVLYPTGTEQAEPMVLPQVLTPAIVRNALDKV
jgi:thiol:disulfide interchange protein DsbD